MCIIAEGVERCRRRARRRSSRIGARKPYSLPPAADSEHDGLGVTRRRSKPDLALDERSLRTPYLHDPAAHREMHQHP